MVCVVISPLLQVNAATLFFIISVYSFSFDLSCLLSFTLTLPAQSITGVLLLCHACTGV